MPFVCENLANTFDAADLIITDIEALVADGHLSHTVTQSVLRAARSLGVPRVELGQDQTFSGQGALQVYRDTTLG